MKKITGILVPACLVAGAAMAGDGLAGSEWGTTGEARFVRFETGGKVVGHGGCNRFFGSYRTTGNGGIEIGPLGSTRMACAGDIMERETEFLGKLGKTAAYERHGTSLSLSDEAGTKLLELRQRDWD